MLIKKGGILRNIKESCFNEYANKGYKVLEKSDKTGETAKKKSVEKG